MESLMRFQNKNRIAYLGALTLLFSYAETILPRIVPFFRLGLGNIVILLAFDLNFPSFLLLTIIKALTSCLMSGTLFSPFFLISLAQSIISGLAMYALALANSKTKNKLASLYGISILGSTVSAFVQIFLSSLYLGSGTNALLGPLLIFSLFSGIFTAFFSQILHIPKQAPELISSQKIQKNQKKQPVLLIALLILLASASIFMINNLIILLVALILSLFFQILSKRKIYILPHLTLWIFVIISTILIPNGKILYKIGDFSITQGALLDGIRKATKLSAVSALSQCAASLRPNGNGLVSLVLAYFGGLNKAFRDAEGEGNFIGKLKVVLRAEKLEG